MAPNTLWPLQQSSQNQNTTPRPNQSILWLGLAEAWVGWAFRGWDGPCDAVLLNNSSALTPYAASDHLRISFAEVTAMVNRAAHQVRYYVNPYLHMKPQAGSAQTAFLAETVDPDLCVDSAVCDVSCAK